MTVACAIYFSHAQQLSVHDKKYFAGYRVNTHQFVRGAYLIKSIGYMILSVTRGFRVEEGLSCVFSAVKQQGKARNLALP